MRFKENEWERREKKTEEREPWDGLERGFGECFWKGREGRRMGA